MLISNPNLFMNVSVMSIGSLIDHVGNEIDLSRFGCLNHMAFASDPRRFTLDTELEALVTRIMDSLLWAFDFLYFEDNSI